MAQIAKYWVHDPVGNFEAMMTDFRQESLKAGADAGLVYIAEDTQGNRSIVSYDEVKEPSIAASESYAVFVQPVYVDDRMKAVVDVFDALAAETDTAAATDATTMTAGKTRSSMTFAQALEALRDLAYGTGEVQE